MFDDSKVTYSVECLPEVIESRGNAGCSGDEGFDRQVEKNIIADLEAGNEWAWCTIKVTARYDGVDGIVGVDWLGCCNYSSEEDFKKCPYFEDMKNQARDDLYQYLESHIICLRRAGLID